MVDHRKRAERRRAYYESRVNFFEVNTDSQ